MAEKLRVTMTREYQGDVITLPAGTVIDLPERIARQLNSSGYASITPSAANPVQIVPGGGGVTAGGAVTSITYDGSGRVSVMVVDGITHTFSYDGNGRLSTITDGTTTRTVAYNGNGSVASVA